MHKVRYNRGPAEYERIASMVRKLDGSINYSIQSIFTPSHEEEILERSMLRKENEHREVKSAYERLFVLALSGSDFPVLYEPLSLPLTKRYTPNITLDHYIPDFLLPNHYVGDRAIVIEPHSPEFISIRYLKRFEEVRERYGLYVILATDPSFSMMALDERRVLGFVDEFWYVRDINNNGVDQ